MIDGLLFTLYLLFSGLIYISAKEEHGIEAGFALLIAVVWPIAIMAVFLVIGALVCIAAVIGVGVLIDYLYKKVVGKGSP